MQLNEKQLAGMLRIQAAGRMDSQARFPRSFGRKLHHATLKALIKRDMVVQDAAGRLHVTLDGRDILFARLASTVAPCGVVRPCLALPEPKLPVLTLTEELAFPRPLFVQTSRRRRMTHAPADARTTVH